MRLTAAARVRRTASLRTARLRTVRAAACAVLLLAAGPALAQTNTPRGTAPDAGADAAQAPLMTAPRPDDTPTTDPTASQSGVSGSAPSDELQRPAMPPAPPSVAAIPGSLTPEEARALIGKDLRSRDGQALGRIKDFTLKDAGGDVDRMVLSPDQDVGTEKKLVSVPTSMLRLDLAGPDRKGPPILDLPASELARAPEFTYSNDIKTMGGAN